jgi:hypothetical protein
MTGEARAQRRAVTPLGTEGTGWDVGEAVLFLPVSDPGGSPAVAVAERNACKPTVRRQPTRMTANQMKTITWKGC